MKSAVLMGILSVITLFSILNIGKPGLHADEKYPLRDLAKDIFMEFRQYKRKWPFVILPGKTNSMKTGGIFCVELETNPTTGYNWYVKITGGKNIRLLEDRTFMLEDDEKTGAPSMRIWRYRAAGKGTSTLVYKYYRVWEGENSAESVRKFMVRVE